jgi:hypothetical protein
MTDGLGAARNVGSTDGDESRTGQALADMLEQLRAIPDRGQEANFTRQNVIEVLKIIEKAVSEGLDTEIGRLDDGTTIYAKHHISELISGLAKAFGDLVFGKTDELFKPNPHGANRMLSWRQRERDRVLIQTLQIYRRSKGKKNQKKAAADLAKALKAEGYQRNGKILTGQQIVRLKSH